MLREDYEQVSVVFDDQNVLYFKSHNYNALDKKQRKN